ncbi:hypothetical protein [Phascolarctobacterium succinatutens]|uniref:hypothetical protein n=1 Tax=Phascolarctobacterium succinatutens TaxID=626940 RepID=UPI003FD6F7E4
MLSNFTQQDISSASYLTKLTWGDEMALTNDGLKDVLYEAMVRYYYRSEDFSLKMTDAEGMQGFLLAAPLSERDNSQSWLKQSLQHFECEEQDLVYDYLRYLSYNGQKVRALANPEDLLLCLFLSMKSGVGSKLLYNVEAIAQKKGVKKLYLWADATCDYEYYRKRGYSEAAHFTNNILPQLGAQETWIYSKELKE